MKSQSLGACHRERFSIQYPRKSTIQRPAESVCFVSQTLGAKLLENQTTLVITAWIGVKTDIRDVIRIPKDWPEGMASGKVRDKTDLVEKQSLERSLFVVLVAWSFCLF